MSKQEFSKNEDDTSKNNSKIPTKNMKLEAAYRWFPIDSLQKVTKEIGVGACAYFFLRLPINLGVFYLQKRLMRQSTNFHSTFNTVNAKSLWGSRHDWLYAPLKEEIIFRGILLPVTNQGLETLGLKEKSAKFGSIIINGIIFGASHPKGNRIRATIGGMIYSGLTIYHHGSLWSSTTAHGINNVVASIAIIKSRKP